MLSKQTALTHKGKLETFPGRHTLNVSPGEYLEGRGGEGIEMVVALADALHYRV